MDEKTALQLKRKRQVKSIVLFSKAKILKRSNIKVVELKPLKIPESVSRRVEELGGMEAIMSTIMGEEEILTLSRVFNAMADPIRVKLMLLLKASPLCVCLLKQALSLSDSKLSYHLSTLKSANLISAQREGKFLICNLTPLGEKALAMLERLKVP
jgi:ArsR family transcriptional regulator